MSNVRASVPGMAKTELSGSERPPGPMSDETPLGVLVGRLAQADANRPAISCAGESVSRAELESRTNRLARAYRELGVMRDSFVTIGLPNGIGLLEEKKAAWKVG